jgi:hypothetical protein
MGTRLSNWLRRVSTGWVVGLALVIFLLFSALVLPRQAATAEQTAGDIGSPDLSLYYSADDLYQMAAAYGPEGRKAYVRARFTFDLVWPLVYTVFLATAISWVMARALPPASRWQVANLAPLVGAVFDVLENASTSVVMLRYPDPTAGVDLLAPVFTLLKWVFVGTSSVLLVGGVLAFLWRWNQERAR